MTNEKQMNVSRVSDSLLASLRLRIGAHVFHISVFATLLATLCALPLNSVIADEQQDENANAEQSADDTPLTVRQEAIQQRYRRFEEMIRQTAEYLRQTDPERSNLLYRVLQKGQENRVLGQMRGVFELLEKEQLGDAAEQQQQLIEQMAALLKLLQSEGRKNEIEREKERLTKLVADISRLMGREKSIRSGTARGKDLKSLEKQQKKVADDTKQLNKDIDAHDKERSGSDSESEKGEKGSDEKSPSKDGSPSDKSQSEKSPSDNKPKDGKPSDSENSDSKKPSSDKSDQPNSKGDPSQSQQKSDSKSGQPSPDSQPGQKSDQNTPGKKQLEQARKEMERAIEALKKEQRNKAEAHQEESIAKLLEAKEKLEEILRQLREEEQELMLASLEARILKMWDKQSSVNEGTVNVAKTDQAEWTSRHFASLRKVIELEEEVISEADKALMLLKEEGSSVAFPESLRQLREDMIAVTKRLEQQQVGDLTQTIEQEILESLGEMIEALRKEIDRKQQEKKQKSQNSQSSGDQAQRLVEILCELKMLKTLQIRINKRTTRISEIIESKQPADDGLVEQLQTLSERQSRIQEATYKLATEQNRVDK